MADLTDRFPISDCAWVVSSLMWTSYMQSVPSALQPPSVGLTGVMEVDDKPDDMAHRGVVFLVLLVHSCTQMNSHCNGYVFNPFLPLDYAIHNTVNL